MRFLADENFNHHIVRGLLDQNPDIDIIRIQDTEVFQADDPTLLAWAAKEGRILLTHDFRTVPKFAFERVAQGLDLPGVIEVRRDISIGRAIEELYLLIIAGNESDFINQIRYIPLH